MKTVAVARYKTIRYRVCDEVDCTRIALHSYRFPIREVTTVDDTIHESHSMKELQLCSTHFLKIKLDKPNSEI